MFKRLIKIDTHHDYSAFIFGPRGTGKTSWLKDQFPTALYFDLLNDDIFTDFLAKPTRLDDLIPQNYTGWIIIDEIQKVPALLNEVHRLIEHRKQKFILTGSSARALRKKGVNLLAGRALTYHMYPLTATEMGSKFSLEKALKWGELPAIYTKGSAEKYLSSYIKTYLREEVLQEGLTRNIALFTRFLEAASFSQGQTLNYTEIGREVGSNRFTILNFFEILEDLLIAYRIPVFSKCAKRDIISAPKFYYFDVGVYRSIRPQGPLDSIEKIDGPALETLFLQEAIAINHYFNLGHEFHYWRTRSQIEVDFIAYGKNGLIAFEIKRKTKIVSSDLRGLLEFKKDYPMAKLILLYGGKEEYTDHDIQIIPFESALKNLRGLLS